MERRERRRKKEEEGGETKSSKEPKKVSVEDQKLYTETLCIGVKEENLRLIRLLLAKDETSVNEVWIRMGRHFCWRAEVVSPLSSSCY